MAITDPVADRLLKSSARHSYDPDVDIDWEAPLVDGLYYMQPERLSLYGTETWNGLSEEQRIELSRHEVASLSSVGIWFEVILMQMMVRDLYSADPQSQTTHYALTEIGDETRHCVMFGKALARVGVPAYGPTPRIHRMGRLMKYAGFGPCGYAGILVAEEVLDRWQRELMKDERVQPLVRMVSRIHVTEEARHITFAREQIERAMPRLSAPMLAYHQLAAAQIAFVMSRALVNPEVYRSIGIPPARARREALANPNYQDTLRWMGEKVTAYLEEVGLIPDRQKALWRRAFLIA